MLAPSYYKYKSCIISLACLFLPLTQRYPYTYRAPKRSCDVSNPEPFWKRDGNSLWESSNKIIHFSNTTAALVSLLQKYETS
jgi:hypothetical protein